MTWLLGHHAAAGLKPYFEQMKKNYTTEESSNKKVFTKVFVLWQIQPLKGGLWRGPKDGRLHWRCGWRQPTSIYLAWLSLFLWEAALNLIATLYLTVCWEQCPSNCRQTPFFLANRSGRSGIYNIYRYSIWCRCFTTDFPFMCLPDSQRSQGLVLVEDSVGPLGGWVPEKYC